MTQAREAATRATSRPVGTVRTFGLRRAAEASIARITSVRMRRPHDHAECLALKLDIVHVDGVTGQHLLDLSRKRSKVTRKGVPRALSAGRRQHSGFLKLSRNGLCEDGEIRAAPISANDSRRLILAGKGFSSAKLDQTNNTRAGHPAESSSSLVALVVNRQCRLLAHRSRFASDRSLALSSHPPNWLIETAPPEAGFDQAASRKGGAKGFWLRHQPRRALAKWFSRRCGASHGPEADPRARRRSRSRHRGRNPRRR